MSDIELYQPEEGTSARAAIDYFVRRGAGPLLGTRELAQAIGRMDKVQSLVSQLALAVRAGLLRRERGERGGLLWGLGHRLDKDVRRPDEEVPGVVRLGPDAASSVFAYAQHRDAAAFSVAMATDGRLTVERYGRVVVEFTDQERRTLLQAAQCGVAPPEAAA